MAEGMTFPAMRPQIEIQFMHDMLMGMFATKGLAEAVVPREYRGALAMATDCLCWVLRHDVDAHPHSHAGDFARVLQDVKTDLEKIGWGWEPPEGAEYRVE